MTTDPARYITDEAVKAATKAQRLVVPAWEDVEEDDVRVALAAALPHIEAAIRVDERLKVTAEHTVNGIHLEWRDGATLLVLTHVTGESDRLVLNDDTRQTLADLLTRGVLS